MIRERELHTYQVRDAADAVVAEFPDIGEAVEFRNECAHPGEHLRVTIRLVRPPARAA